MTTLNDNWLDIATSHAATKWLKSFLQKSLPKLLTGKLSDQGFAQQLHQALLNRNLLSPKQQKNYRSNTVQALKSIDENHPAIPLVALTTDQYRELNDLHRGRLAGRLTQFFSSNTAEQLVDKATAMLGSSEWSEVAAGLAVLIGRRISEILLSDFSLNSQWCLNFTGMAKKGQTDGLTLQIPTLAPAPIVLDAIQKLHKTLAVKDLKLDSLSPKMAKQTVNHKFSQAVAHRCEQHFSHLIPTRTDRDNLYTHLFRAVYATIAAHWFCPPSVPEHNFKAEIQGHFTLTKDGKKLPNFSARANYDDYAIGDDRGNRGALGIKLGKLPGLEVIDAFHKSPRPIMDNSSTTAPITLDDGIMNAFVYRATNLLLDKDPQSVAVGLVALTGRLPDDLLNGGWLADSVFSIRRRDGPEIPTLCQSSQILSAIQKLVPNSVNTISNLDLIAKNTFDSLLLISSLAQLQALYTQVALWRFCPTHVQDETFIESINGLPAPLFLLPSQKRGSWLNRTDVTTLPALSQSHQIMPTLSDAPSLDSHNKPRYKSIKVELNQLQQLCQQFDIPIGRGHGYEAALTKLFDLVAQIGLLDDTHTQPLEDAQIQMQSEPEPLDWSRALADQARTLGVLAARLEASSEQLQLLQAENQQLKANQSSADQNSLLQAENQRLKKELEQTQAQLTGIQNLLGGKTELVSMPMSTTPTLAIDSTSTSTSTKLEKIPKEKARRNKDETNAKIHQVIDALIQWNTTQSQPERLIRIATNPIKSIAAALNANYQPAIQAALNDRAEELEQLHNALLLGSRHNAGIKNKGQLLQTIAKDILNLDNWDQIRWIG